MPLESILKDAVASAMGATIAEEVQEIVRQGDAARSARP